MVFVSCWWFLLNTSRECLHKDFLQMYNAVSVPMQKVMTEVDLSSVFLQHFFLNRCLSITVSLFLCFSQSICLCLSVSLLLCLTAYLYLILPSYLTIYFYLSPSLYFTQQICHCTYLPLCLHISLIVLPSVYMPLSLSLSLSLSLLSFSLSIYLYIWLYVYLSPCRPVSLPCSNCRNLFPVSLPA